jgi:hypothetical protein
MGLHVYCIVPRGHHPDPSLTGVAGGTVAFGDVADDGIALWYSEHAARPAVEAAAVVAHNAVVAAAMTREVTPVPMRFGQWFDTLDAAVDRVTADAAKWLADLARFRGRAEYGVRVVPAAPQERARDVHPAAAVSGTEYMAALARRHAGAEQRRALGDAIATQLAAALGDVVADRRVALLEDGGLISCAYLVALERASDYHAILAHVRRSRSDLRFVITGPWPPYSFVA